MHLTILGATGGTGVRLVEQALHAGHEVTAVVRDPARLPVADRAGLSVVTADPLTGAALAEAVAGVDAVVSALGAPGREPTTVCRDGARAALDAMTDAGVRRLLVISNAPIHVDRRSTLGYRWTAPVVRRVFRHAYADARAMEEVVAASDVDWTIVCPPRLTDDPGGVPVERALDRTVSTTSISRADLATEILSAVDDDTTIGHRLFVAAA